MTRTLSKTISRDNTARNAWIAFGGLIALGIVVLTLRELPSMRREMKLLRM
jgi:hypothetical protein